MSDKDIVPLIVFVLASYGLFFVLLLFFRTFAQNTKRS